jgi:hypothetical protein
MLLGIIITVAITGLMLRLHEGGDLKGEPLVTAIYLVWPLALIVICVLSTREAYCPVRIKGWVESREADPEDKKTIPKDLN